MSTALRVAFARLETLPDAIAADGGPLVVMPFIDVDLARRSALQLAGRAGAAGTLLCVQDTKRLGFIAVANAVFRRSGAAQFAYVAQDAYAGRNWLALALEALKLKDGGLAAFNDGKWGGSLAAFGLADREWAAGNYGGDLFFPGYRRHYADVELTLIAMQQRKFRFDPLSVLVEVDWQKEDSGIEPEDRLLYYRRGQSSFDRKVTSQALKRLFK